MLAKLKKLLPEVMFQDIETLTSLGVPDICYGYKDVMGWIELKEVNRDVKKRLTIPWRPGQLAWYKRYKQKVNMPYLLVLTIKNQWYIIDNIKEKYTIDELNKFKIQFNRNEVHKSIFTS